MGEIVFVIPARSGSKGVVDKNIKLLAGFPLIAYSIMAAKLSEYRKRIIVSTDSDRYAQIAREYGAEVPFLRPKEISTDTSTDYDFMKHLIDWMINNEKRLPKYMVHLRPTTPLREPEYINLAIKKIMNDPDATALRSVHEMSESAYKSFEVENNYLKCIFSDSFDIEKSNMARQLYKKTYQANGYVDIIKTEYVLENKKLHGDRVIAFITPYAIEVDTIEDFNYLEYMSTKNPAIVNRLFKNRRP